MFFFIVCLMSQSIAVFIIFDHQTAPYLASIKFFQNISLLHFTSPWPCTKFSLFTLYFIKYTYLLYTFLSQTWNQPFLQGVLVLFNGQQYLVAKTWELRVFTATCVLFLLPLLVARARTLSNLSIYHASSNSIPYYRVFFTRRLYKVMGIESNY